MPSSPVVTLSFILPVLNEQGRIATTLTQLRRQYPAAQLVVVDGGSHDDTVQNARPLCDQLLETLPGRALQMNAGAAAATGAYLFFLHADSQLAIASSDLQAALGKRPKWGFCRVRLSGTHPMFGVIAGCMNVRSTLTRVATGDQMLFVEREVFIETGGFDLLPLMEDIALSKRLRKIAAPLILKPAVLTSSRRWRERGIVKTILEMWWLRLAYFFGVSPQYLWRRYYGPDIGSGSPAGVDICIDAKSVERTTLHIQFAREPVVGEVKTRLQPHFSPEQACDIHCELVRLTNRRLVEAALGPVELSVAGGTQHPLFAQCVALGTDAVQAQHGSDLGERMYNALHAGIARYPQVLLVGSDCPVLDADYLEAASDALREVDVVLGPAEDGGYVLIGARRVDMCWFEGVQWGGSNVLADTVSRLRQTNTRYRLLPQMWDVDRPQDVSRWRSLPS